jgi:hypothetical protein
MGLQTRLNPTATIAAGKFGRSHPTHRRVDSEGITFQWRINRSGSASGAVGDAPFSGAPKLLVDFLVIGERG